MDRKYKPLLPALKFPSDQSDSSGHSPTATKRRRMYVKIACDICRTKKTACDGQRPSCTPCVKRKSPCTFSGRPSGSDESRSPGLGTVDNDTDSASIITALLTAHDAEAHDLLDRMRRGRGTLEVLGPWSEEDGPENVPTLLPPDQTSVEFELMTRFPVAYPALVPLDSHNQNVAALDVLQVEDQPVDASESESAATRSKDLPDGTSFEPFGQNAYESRLRQVHFAKWTDIPISGAEAACAIGNYLAHDHVFLHLFDTELFLESLTSGDDSFCSPLLVNALLGWSLPGITTTNSEYGERASMAFEVAAGQFEKDTGQPSVNTLAAAELLSLTALFRGQGARSHSFLKTSISMGQKMGLLSKTNDPESRSNISMDGDGGDRARATAAWGLFSFATMHSFHCQRNELAPSLVPPFAIPGANMEIVTSVAPRTARESQKLWVLINEMSCHYYNGNANSRPQIRASFVSSMLHRLLYWANQLPISLARGNRSTQQVMIMHTHLHAAVMALLYPLVLQGDQSPLVDGDSEDRSAEAIYKASAAQMHRLVDIYHLRSQTTNTSVFWHTSLLYSANAALRSSGGALPTRRRRFNRSMTGFADLSPRYPVFQVVYCGLMTMAVETGVLGSPEAVRLARRLAGKEGSALFANEKPTEACFVIDLELAHVDRSMALVDRLSQRFNEIIMFDDFTHA